MNKEISHIPEGTMEFLRQQDWPGNIRELQNFVERAALMSSGPSSEIPFLEIKRLVDWLHASAGPAPSLKRSGITSSRCGTPKRRHS